jgi:hypothetical protein
MDENLPKTSAAGSEQPPRGRLEFCDVVGGSPEAIS